MSASSIYSNGTNIDSLSQYLGTISKYPLLSEQKETALASKVFSEKCQQSINALVLPHLRYVAHIARGFAGYGLPILDLIQAGNVGLIKAIKRFNPQKGNRLVSFAIHWIKSEINEFIIRNWSIVKVATTKEQRKLFFNLKKYKQDASWVNETQAKKIADELRVQVKDVYTMDGRLSQKDKQMDNYHHDEDFHSPYTEDSKYRGYQEDFADSHERDNWNQHLSAELRVALNKLDKRSRDIILHRWLSHEKVTLADLAEKHQLSSERIRQIEIATLTKLKTLLGHIPMAAAA
ncbi:RNA polymerase sigma factor RpoH [Vibrio maritimus]|uniref:RNA polymerase sigma factor n=1 Tax=Vibrio maritimus TaxID=990268 RepID=A0A090T790_9VIBR|nr:RNA polymerase sigma factor RpoH [Vibrio maritimus]